MRIWNRFTGVLLILLGFCAGVALNLLPINTIVHGASDNSLPALKSVAHNATLAGDGTAAAPLGIANGGVTAPKLSTSAIPSPGQVLGFNGANLAWQNAPVGGWIIWGATWGHSSLPGDSSDRWVHFSSRLM
jgi:hypothetical protein